MKVRKPIWGFLLLILLTAIFAIVIHLISSNEMIKREDDRIQLKIDGVAKTLDSLEAEITDAIMKNNQRKDALQEMMELSLKTFMQYGRYNGPEIFEDGFVVRIDGDKIIYPEGQEALPGLDAEVVKNNSTLYTEALFPGNDEDRFAEVRSVPIGGSYYYIDLADDARMLDSALETVRLKETIREIEKSYDCRLLIVSLPDSNKNKLAIPDMSPQFLILPTGADDPALEPENIGIDEDFISKEPADFQYNGKSYRCDYDRITFLEFEFLVIILNSLDREIVYLFNSVILYVSLTVIAGVCVILWLYWIQTYVRDNELHTDQFSAYKPKRIRKRVKAIVLIGGLAIFLLAIFFQSLSNLNREALSNRDALDTVMDRLAEHADKSSANQVVDEDWAVYVARRIATILKENDDLWNRDYLERVNDLVGSQYIMLFDKEGANILSSNGLIGYSLTETEPLREFADLLKGVSGIVGQPSPDMITSTKSQLIGVSIPIENEEAYAALIMSVDVENSWGGADERRLGEFLKNATPVGNLCVVIDKENDTAVYASDPALVGDLIPGLAYTDGDPDSSDLDTYTISNNRYYGAYDSNAKYVGYYLTESSYVQGKSVLYAFAASSGFMIIIFLVSWFMLRPYTGESYKAFARLKESGQSGDRIDMGTLDEFFEKNDDDTSVRLKDRWDDLVPEQKIHLFIQIFLGIILLLTILRHFGNENRQLFSSRSTLNFILSGNWTRGLNLLGLAGTLLVIIAFVVFVFVRDVLLKILCGVLDPKGETVCRLAFSLLQYVAVLGGIYLIMGFLGFNTSFQLTSVGIISLAISLGSKDIVADILAGIFIIFEGDFQVGDFVDIEDFQGIVQEIGVRSTKVLGLGDNIKIIGNDSIKNVLNMSKMNTWLTVELKIPSDIPLRDVEELLEKELPEIGKRIPEMISGPYYKGVWSIEMGRKILHFSCECLEQHSRVVRRKLNHDVIVLLESNGYKL